jgi:hypothetical protein
MLSEPKATGTIRKEGNTIAGVSRGLISFNVSLIDRNKKISRLLNEGLRIKFVVYLFFLPGFSHEGVRNEREFGH